MRIDTSQRCGQCGGGKKILAPVATMTVDRLSSVGRELVDCPTCDDGTGPTGLVLVPGRPSGRQALAKLWRRLGRH